MLDQDPNHTNFQEIRTLEQTRTDLVNWGWIVGLKATISTLIYRKLKQLRVELHDHTWACVRAAIRHSIPSLNVAEIYELQPKFVPNLHQLVGAVEWRIFVAKSDKNSLGLGSRVARTCWRRGWRRWSREVREWPSGGCSRATKGKKGCVRL